MVVINKNKKIITGLLIAVLLLGSVYYYLDQTIVNKIHTKAELPMYSQVEQLEEEADVIAIVTPTGNQKNHMEYDAQGLPLWYWTESELIVNKVFSGDVKENESIVIYEPYATGSNKVIGKLEIVPEYYTKMNNSENYIVFLKQHEDGPYMIIGRDQGKVALQESNKQSLGLISEFSDLHQKILAKYAVK